MATNFEKYFNTPEKLANTASCIGDCYECVFEYIAPCSHTFGTDEEYLVKWLKSEAKEENND